MQQFDLSDEEDTSTEVLFTPPKENESFAIKLLFLSDKINKVWINAQIESKSSNYVFYRYYVLTDKNKVSSVRGSINRRFENEQFAWLNDSEKSNSLNCSTFINGLNGENNWFKGNNNIFINKKHKIKLNKVDSFIVAIEKKIIITENDVVPLTDDILWCVFPFVSAYSISFKQWGLINWHQLLPQKIIKDTQQWQETNLIPESEKSLLEQILFTFHLNTPITESFVILVKGPNGSGKSFVCSSVAKLLGRELIQIDKNLIQNESIRCLNHLNHLNNFIFYKRIDVSSNSTDWQELLCLKTLIILESNIDVDIIDKNLINYVIHLSNLTAEQKKKLFDFSGIFQFLNLHQNLKELKIFQRLKEMANDQSFFVDLLIQFKKLDQLNQLT